MNSDTSFLPRLADRSRRWGQLVLPKEHGSWSLVLEPLLLGLLLAPSKSGLFLGGACLAGFFSRRPLKIALTDSHSERRASARAPLAGCVLAAVGATVAAIATGGGAWLMWLVPAAVAGGLFLYFDLRGSAREETAEVAGTIAFAFVPGAMATAAGYRPETAAALIWVACGRAVPTTLFVRAYLRSVKTGRSRPWPALLAAATAAGGGVWLHAAGLVPSAPVVALVVLLCRSAIYLVYPRPVVSARLVGKQELFLGAAFVLFLALTWHSPIR